MSLPGVFESVCEKRGWSFGGNQAEVSTASGRSQVIVLEPFDHEGHDLIRAHTSIGDESAMSETRLRSALALNAGLPHGALALRDGKLVMTDTFVAKDADEDEVEESLRFLAETADRYEKMIFGTDNH